MTNRFQFKQFSITDNDCGMPVSTDAVLLGAWARAGSDQSILDIGTGTGVLALMMAQRFPSAQIVAIDIDEMAATTALFNSAQSAWANSINVVHGDILLWENPRRFDTIICNPPYFTAGLQANDPRRAAARHTNNLSHRDLIKALKNRLEQKKGQAHLILPSLEADNLQREAASESLFCHQITSVKSTPDKPISRKLMTLSLQEPAQCKVNQLIIQEKGKYTADFIALTKDFYLKM